MSYLTAVVLCLHIAVTSVARAETERPKCDYAVSVPSFQKLNAISFTFPLPATDKPASVFFHSVRALIVSQVLIDGKPSIGKANPTNLDVLSPEVLSVRSESYTYVVPVVEGVTFVPQEFASSPDPYFATFRFPAKWSEIELRYKVRFPDKTFTRELVMRITRVQMAP